MAEIKKPYELLKAKLEAGEYDIAVTSFSEGLKESEYSNSVPYTQDENLYYEYSGNGYYIVTGRKTASTDITISSEHDDGENGLKDVREIGAYAFADKDITSVKIPLSVKIIGESAFSGCGSLEEVEIAGLEEIAVYFHNTRNWTDITCFYEVDGEATEKIMTLSGNGICRISVPANTTAIYFGGTNTLGKKEKTSIISEFAHGYCFQCSKKVDENSGAFYAEDYEYESAETSDYVIIGGRAFENCTSLTNINIPNTVREIDGYAFNWCNKITSVTFAKHCPLVSIGSNAFELCYMTELKLPDMLNSIGYYCFNLCYDLASVNIPNRLKYIGAYAFRNCYALSSVSLDEKQSQLERVESMAFYNCKSLQKFTFPATMGEMGGNVFTLCEKLETVTFKSTYGWFYTDSNGDKQHISPENLSDTRMLASILTNDTFVSGTTGQGLDTLTWTKLFQMPAPDISLSLDGVLSITDSTGIADMFTIYAKTAGSDDSNYQAAAWIKDLRKSQ